MRKVEVTTYNKNWSLMFEEEASRLCEIFGPEIITVHHIGSTSVDGLKAKPIIDIMLVVKYISRVDEFTTAMRDNGYESKGENGIIGRRFFQKGGDKRSHHVHIFEVGSLEIEHHLAFRDFLRSHPEYVNKYGNLKEKLSQQFPNDIGAYIHGKEQLVLEIKNKAMFWYQQVK